MIALELGGSSRLCAVLKPGEPVLAMGPTGSATELPENATVLLAGGGLGNAVLFSIGKKARALGQPGHLLRRLQEGRGLLQARRARGRGRRPRPLGRPRRADPGAPRLRTGSFVGNIVEAMIAYGRRGAWARSPIRLSRRRAAHRDRLGPHDGGRRARPPRTSSRRTSRPATSASARSTRRCSA